MRAYARVHTHTLRSKEDVAEGGEGREGKLGMGEINYWTVFSTWNNSNAHTLNSPKAGPSHAGRNHKSKTVLIKLGIQLLANTHLSTTSGPIDAEVSSFLCE